MTTTLQNLQAQRPAQQEQQQEVIMGFGNLQGFELMQRAANVLTNSTLVPVAYRNQKEIKSYGKVTGYEENKSGMANCIVALNMAQRMKADPLMVMQNLHIIEGRPSWSSQFIIAAINSCGRYSPLRFELSEPGEPVEIQYTASEWKSGNRTEVQKTVVVRHQECYAWALEEKTGARLESPKITIQMAIDEGWLTKNGSKWQTMPELMLRYRCASFFGRLYAPELLMGLQSTEENQDIIDVEKGDDGSYGVEVSSVRSGPAKEQRRESIQHEPGETIDTLTGEVQEKEPVATRATRSARKSEPVKQQEPEQEDGDFELDME